VFQARQLPKAAAVASHPWHQQHAAHHSNLTLQQLPPLPLLLLLLLVGMGVAAVLVIWPQQEIEMAQP
jgi:hypothetical protein